jgi:hypothetical protein
MLPGVVLVFGSMMIRFAQPANKSKNNIFNIFNSFGGLLVTHAPV